jgi:hypothetical protein
VRIGRRIGVGVAVLGSLLLALSGAGPALARGGPSAGFSHVTGLRAAAVANATSTTFGGWVFGVTAAASVTAEFKVPALNCTTTMSGVVASSAMLTGSSSSPKVDAASVLLTCSGGKPLAVPAVFVDSTETDGTQAVHAGDLMKATVVTSTTKTTATIADLTAGHTFQFARSGAGGASFDERILDSAFAQGSTLPVVNFGKITFRKCAVGGKAIGTVTPRMAVNMQTSTGVLQILTGAITGTAKNAFTTTWKHS